MLRRRSNALIINITCFLFLLALILYINIPSSENDKVLAWHQVRYQPRTRYVSSPDGACPGLAGAAKPALVIARVEADGDTDWLEGLSNKYHECIYQTDIPRNAASKYLQVPANRGHEAMAYLTFLIDNYDKIPVEGAVFVHGARFQWHNDHPYYDNQALLSALNVSSALATTGYHNLRCDWAASTCERSPAQGSLETRIRSVLEPYNARVVSDMLLPPVLAHIFGGAQAEGNAQVQLGRSDSLRAQCCAQFIVSRDRIWQHSRYEYEALRQWLLDDGAAPPDDQIAGRILSYIWHILFLPKDNGAIRLNALNSMACPKAKDCYCQLYGRCDLHGCIPGRCPTQYQIPPKFRLPEGWAERHS